MTTRTIPKLEEAIVLGVPIAEADVTRAAVLTARSLNRKVLDPSLEDCHHEPSPDPSLIFRM